LYYMLFQLSGQRIARLVPGSWRHKSGDGLPGNGIRDADDRRFGNRRMAHERALDLHGPNPVAGAIQNIVYASKQPEIPVIIPARTVARQVDARVLAPVDRLVPVRVTPDRARHRRPWPSDYQVTTGICGHAIALLVEDISLDTGEWARGRAGLGRDDSRQGSNHDLASFGLPPGIHDWTVAVANILVVPDPGLRIDRLTYCTQQAQ